MKLSKMNINKWFLTLAILVYSIAGFAQTTVDLSLHQPGAAPSGSTFEWHNATPANTSNLVTDLAAKTALTGTYYGVFSATGCYSPESKMSVLINACPVTTVDLTSYVSAANLEWHTSSTPSTLTKVPDFTIVATAGTYFAFSNNAGTYSAALGMVVVAINNCADITAPLAPTIVLVTPLSNGKIEVSGTAEPGSTVIVTFPDGTLSAPLLVTIGGNYGPVASATPQTSGIIYAQATDLAGNKSPIANKPYTDTTAPLAPTIDLVTANPNGTISVSGTAEPNSTVVVTFPDGTTGTYPVLADGKYGPVTSTTPQTSGIIYAQATDVAGNKSPIANKPYTDTTAPLAPTIDLVTTFPNGTIAVSGTAEPGSKVIVTFPDGSTSLPLLVTAAGNYGPVASATPQTSGIIYAQATDVAGNVSPKASYIFNTGSGPTTPTIVLTENPGGTLEVNGKADPGSIVTITFPDGTIKMVLTDALGNYGPVKSDFPQPNGDVKAIATLGGATSPENKVPYVDKTAPNAPKINLPITINPNGIVEVSGTAEPKSTVFITFPDGSTESAVVDDAGKFGPIVSRNPQITGTITALVRDINNIPSTESKENIVIGGIALIKTGVLNDTNNDGFQQAGETITYSFTVINTANVTLTDVNITDPLPGIEMSGSPFSLAVGATNAVAYKGVYTLKQSDIITGSVSNQATASGKTPALAIITDLSDDTNALGNTPTVVTTDGCVIEVFNGLTPGGDGKNDVFYIRGIECFPNNSIQVFNRWGIVVFDKTGYNNTDRAFRGVSEGNLTVAKTEELPVGTYYYVFKYTDNAAVSHEKAGYLYINK